MPSRSSSLPSVPFPSQSRGTAFRRPRTSRSCGPSGYLPGFPFSRIAARISLSIPDFTGGVDRRRGSSEKGEHELRHYSRADFHRHRTGQLRPTPGEGPRWRRSWAFDLVCLGDRHLWPSGFHELLTTLAALAPVTSRIQLCSSGFILPIYNPVPAGRAGGRMWDVISGGRLIFGLVLGYREEELAISAVQFAGNGGGRFLENLEVISRLWTGESVTYSGKFFRCQDIRIGPLPVSKNPGLPSGSGAPSIGSFDVSARLAGRLDFPAPVSVGVNSGRRSRSIGTPWTNSASRGPWWCPAWASWPRAGRGPASWLRDHCSRNTGAMPVG